MCTLLHRMRDPNLFKPGIYTHYKGGSYVALHIARHHETSEPVIVYFCPKHGTINAREWDSPGKDSWYDMVPDPSVQLRLDASPVMVARFSYVGQAL